MANEPLANSQAQGAAPQIDDLPPADQERLAGLLDSYLQRLERGEPVDSQAACAAHPSLAPYLERCLSGLSLLNDVARKSGWSSTASQAPRPDDSLPRPVFTDFDVIRELGRGGMGVVYEARQRSLNRRVALKVLPVLASQGGSAIARFRNEAQAAAQVRHPNIVPVFAFGEDNGICYYVMQIVEGRSLAAFIDDVRERSGVGPTPAAFGEDIAEPPALAATPRADVGSPIDPALPRKQNGAEFVARIGVQAAAALHAAHQVGILHRDVKPSNLLVDHDDKLWVTDFGLARFHDQPNLTKTGDVVGTMRYMSPEQMQGDGSVLDQRSDVYSLGLTLYELAAGRHPAAHLTDSQLLASRGQWRPKPLRHWAKSIPRDLETIILKAMAEAPHERYAAAGSLADDLQRFLDGKAISAAPPSLASRTQKWVRRHRRVAATVAAVSVLIFAGQSYNTLLLLDKNREKDAALRAAQGNLHQALIVLDRAAELGDQLSVIPGADGVRYQWLQDSLSFYADLVERTKEDPARQQELAAALHKLGVLSERLGHSDEAIARYREAASLWLECERSSPDAALVRSWATTQNNLGMALLRSDRGAQAIAVLEQVRRRLEVSGDHDDDRLLAATMNNLGYAYETRGEKDKARRALRRGIALAEKVLDPADGTHEGARSLAAAYANLASLDAADNGAKAAANFERALAIQRTLANESPENQMLAAELAQTASHAGKHFAAQESWRQAQSCYAEAVTLLERLVAASPQTPSHRRNLAIACNNRGQTQTRLGDYAAAESSFRRSVDLSSGLIESDTASSAELSRLAAASSNLAIVYVLERADNEANTTFKAAIQYARRALESQPDDARPRDQLIQTYLTYARYLEDHQERDAARSANVAARRLAAEAPRHPAMDNAP